MPLRPIQFIKANPSTLLMIATVWAVCLAPVLYVIVPNLLGPLYSNICLAQVGGQWYGRRGPGVGLLRGSTWIRFDHDKTGDLTDDQWTTALHAQRHNTRLKQIQFIGYDADKEFLCRFVDITNARTLLPMARLRNCTVDPHAVEWALEHDSAVSIRMEYCTFDPAESPDDLAAIERLHTRDMVWIR